MDINACLILIDEIDKTSSVQNCRLDANKPDYFFVTFSNNPREYSYSRAKCVFLENPVVLDERQYKISKDDRIFFKIEKILKFDKYLRIFFRDNISRVYSITQLLIEGSCLLDPNAMSVFSYFDCIVRTAGLQVKLDSGESTNLLQTTYEKLHYIDTHSVLNRYLKGIYEPDNTILIDTLVYPFGSNASQLQAVKRAMTNQISVIEGPPGTGKTQTILNIISNIIIAGKTVAVVSGNNSATDNVFEKLNKNYFGFICAPLGRKDKKGAFISGQRESYPDELRFFKSSENINSEKNAVHNLIDTIADFFTEKNQLEKIKQNLSDYCNEQDYFNSYIETNKFNITPPQRFERFSPSTALSLWHFFDNLTKKNKRVTFFTRIQLLLQFHIWDSVFFKKNVYEIVLSFQYLYYKVKIAELTKTVSSHEARMTDFDVSANLKALTEKSLSILKNSLFEKYQTKTERPIFDNSCFITKTKEFTDEYPVMLSTTYSIKNCIAHDFLFDYIIIDEASQVDLVTGILALSCAKNAVIVGDLMQLPNVVTADVKKIVKPIFDSFKISNGYEYCENSLLSSVCTILPDVPRTLLCEHYRCHPKIIGFCNQKFYGDQLIVMTQDKGERDVLKAHITTKGSHERDRINQRQIDEITNVILPEFQKKFSCEEIGIISPYKKQAERISGDELTSGMEVSTVHKFQGREKEAIIITTVDNEISEFTDNPNLLNVAISRAKKQLSIVVSDNEHNQHTNIGDLIKYIQYHNFEVVKSSICSVFDLLYKEYTTELQKKLQNAKRISSYNSENLVYNLLLDICAKKEFERFSVISFLPLYQLVNNIAILDEAEKNYALQSGTHVDFVIYNKFDRLPVLSIEVDGYRFHKAGTKQANRDSIKNRIFEKIGIRLLRLSTTGSCEKEKIIEILKKAESKVIRIFSWKKNS